MTALVIGGGPAGASLATWLALAGASVALVERDAGPTDKVCGEFLSHEAGGYLTSLGLDVTALGAVPIAAMRFVRGAHVVRAPLPFPAVSLSRRVLDEALLEQAVEAGATLHRGVKVTELTRTGEGWTARLEGRSTVSTRAAFLATGKHDLRGHGRPVGLHHDLVAFKMHWRLGARQASELEGHVELVLFDGGYAGLQPIEGGAANLCLVVRHSRLRALGHSWDRVLSAVRAESPHIEARLASAEASWAKPLALSRIPYGHVQSRSDGLWRIGDQAAVIPSFSGDGISIALHSAGLAAATYLAGGDADSYQMALSRELAGQVQLATLLSHALVRSGPQWVLGAVASLWPRILPSVASHTRVSERALRRVGAELPRGRLAPMKRPPSTLFSSEPMLSARAIARSALKIAGSKK
jgi:flavin-dependent dehydrogenase